jgi:hypothetical protein
MIPVRSRALGKPVMAMAGVLLPIASAYASPPGLDFFVFGLPIAAGVALIGLLGLVALLGNVVTFFTHDGIRGWRRLGLVAGVLGLVVTGLLLFTEPLRGGSAAWILLSFGVVSILNLLCAGMGR